MKVPVEKIIIPEERARARYTDEQRAYLRASLGKYGQLSEILVRPLPGGRYELIDGESRLRGLMDAGALEVDAKILQLDDRDSSMVNLLMNVARGDQDPMGISLVLGKAMEAGMGEDEVAAATGHTVGWVKFILMLRDLPDVYQDALREGLLLVTHVREALRLPNPKEVDAALGSAIRFGWNTSVTKNYVDNRLAEYMAVKIMREKTGVEVPPPALEPQRLARFSQCLCCGEMVETDRLSLPRICDECYTFAKYAVSQCGKGDPGMQLLYKALELFQQWQQQQRRFFLDKELEKHPLEAPSSIPSIPATSHEIESIVLKPGDVTPEEWEELKKRARARQP